MYEHRNFDDDDEIDDENCQVIIEQLLPISNATYT